MHDCVFVPGVTEECHLAEEYELSENEEGWGWILLLLLATIIPQESDLWGGWHTNTHTRTHTLSLGISSAVPSTLCLLHPSSSSSCPHGPKHLCLPDLVPLGTGSGPLAADCRFLPRIKPANGSHSVMIYTALLYKPATASFLLMVYYTEASLGFIALCSIWGWGLIK